MIGSKKSVKQKTTKNNRGFTLVEILVSLAIFSSALVIISGIFLFSIRAQQKTSVIERVQSDARYSLETMVRELRAGKIDYARYGNAITMIPEEALYLKNPAGEEMTFFRGLCENDLERYCLKISINGETADITSKDARVSDLYFYIKPLSDPFRPLPRQASDCLWNFDAENKICLCEEENAATQCFPDERCELADPGDGEPAVSVCRNPDIQPRVTMVLVVESASEKEGEKKRVELETTVTTKQYER